MAEDVEGKGVAGFDCCRPRGTGSPTHVTSFFQGMLTFLIQDWHPFGGFCSPFQGGTRTFCSSYSGIPASSVEGIDYTPRNFGHEHAARDMIALDHVL